MTTTTTTTLNKTWLLDEKKRDREGSASTVAWRPDIRWGDALATNMRPFLAVVFSFFCIIINFFIWGGGGGKGGKRGADSIPVLKHLTRFLACRLRIPTAHVLDTLHHHTEMSLPSAKEKKREESRPFSRFASVRGVDDGFTLEKSVDTAGFSPAASYSEAARFQSFEAKWIGKVG